MVPERVLISGGSGFIGEHLTNLLQKEGFEVWWLTRNFSKPGKKGVKTFLWNPETGSIDSAALDCDYLVHLAGANIGEERWTKGRKQEIMISRQQGTDTLAEGIRNKLKTGGHKLKAIVAASAIGIYGYDTDNSQVFTEESPSGTGFQAEVTIAWEQSEEELKDLCGRLLKYRFGVVFGKHGGALPKMLTPIKFGIGAIGSGEQIISWVHLDDVCRSILHGIQNRQLDGAYNIVAPNYVSNETFTRVAAKVLHRFIWFPIVPEFLIKLAVGEMGILITGGSRVSSQKLLDSGFVFNYPTLEQALNNLAH